MQKDKWGFWLFFVLVLGFCTSLVASDKDKPFQHDQNRINKLNSVPKKVWPPLPPDFNLPGEVQKPCQASATAGTGAISGSVTQASGGDPIEGVWIGADQLFCPYSGGGTYSDPDGYYVIDMLPAGEYVVYTENESVFVDVYWDNKPDENSADTVIVASDATIDNIDFSLDVGGKITGLITLPGATSVSVTVTAKNIASGQEYPGYADNPSGNSATYVVNRLPTGSYKVWTDNSQGYLDEYYNDQPDEPSADAVPVTLGLTTSGINFTLALGGKITGTVTLPGATSVFVGINAINTSTGESFSTYAINYAGSDTTYEIIGLPTGTYKVRANDLYSNYLDEYYDDQPDSASANLVSVTAGSTHSGIDFTLSLGGIIKGTISSSTKGQLNGIFVAAHSTLNPSVYRGATSNFSGNYRITGLKSGNYKILAEGDNTYTYRYYNNKDSWSVADPVSVTAPDSVTGEDISLEVGGSISGFVYGDGAVPVSGAFVFVYGNDFFDTWSLLKVVPTAANGSYNVGGFRTGNYTVLSIIVCDQMWYQNKPVWATPDSVHVTMPDNTPGIDFNFPSAVEDEETQTASRPTEFELHQNYPNPFNPGTQIEYTLQKRAQVNLEIYNLLGQKVKTLVDDYQSVGSYHVIWDGKNEAGKAVTSGIYFYRLQVNKATQTKRMVLLK
jgi:hypothetical protein